MRISDWSSDVCSSDLAEHQRAELEAGVDVGEEDFLVLEVEQGTDPPRGGNAAEERRRPLVGGDPRRRQQADDAIGPRQVRGAFDEQADRKSTRRTPVTTAHIVCLLLREQKTNT